MYSLEAQGHFFLGYFWIYLWFLSLLNLIMLCSEVDFLSHDFMDCHRYWVISQIFMKDLAQSDFLFCGSGSGPMTTLGCQGLKTWLISDMVWFDSPVESQLCLGIYKEKYFMHLTLYNFIFQIDKKLINFKFFWNTLSVTLTTNTG